MGRSHQRHILVPQTLLRASEDSMNHLIRFAGAALLALAVAIVGRPGSAQAAAKPDGNADGQKAKDIDVVICLDTSGSMDGLIDSAKNKLWDIVNELAKIKPAPNLRVGLYSYGNNGYN